jgi:hypothetical protein
LGTPILLTHGCAPGDITCLTALPRDIHKAFPGKYDIHVSTNCKSLWDHNPHVTSHGRAPGNIATVHLNYGRFISEANRTRLHFITAFHRDFAHRFGPEIACTQPKGDLYLPEWQYKQRPIDGRYWIAVPGHKSDFTTKAWSARRWQQTIDILRKEGLRFVQCGAKHKGNSNPRLEGVTDLVGKTNLRDLLWLIYHAEGVLCHITCFMHMAACFDKPCVIIAGGREHWWWEAYVNVAGLQNFGPRCSPVKIPHRYLHTQGLLDCCKDRGCWKNKVSRLQPDKHRSYCKLPVDDGYGQTIPACHKMITVQHVVEAVMSYYKGGDLPPIGAPGELIVPDAMPEPKRPPIFPAELDLFAPLVPAPPAPTAENKATTAKSTIPEVLGAFEGEKHAKTNQKAPGNPFENPIIDGPMTICVLMYGSYPDMHRACLGSILKTTPASLRELRVVANQVCLPTRSWLEQLKDEGTLHTLVINDDNRKKYPAMRQLFWDENNPITTKWIVWFDDDSIANRDDQWYNSLALKIIAEYPKRARMVGDLRYWTFHPSQLAWAKTRPWWKNRYLQTKQRQPAPNGQNIFFACGGFWALETAAMREAQIPDPDIGHNGGDYMVGLQLWQQGYRTAMWNQGKRHIFTSSVGRRGLNEIHTGMAKWRPGGVPKGQPVSV